MTEDQRRRAPNGDNAWSARAKQLWSDTFRLVPVEGWRPDEVLIMRQICQAITDLSVIETALIGADLILPGSHGGKIANPLLAERRQTRALVLNLAKALKLPGMDELHDNDDLDDPDVIRFPDGRENLTPSARGRRAANTRWHGEAR